MTKEFLAQLDPPFTKWLPPGLQQELAEEFSLHYQVVGRVLRGQEGSDETIMAVYLAAKRKLRDNLQELSEMEDSFNRERAR